MRRRFIRPSKDLDENLINLTPLIDVVFVVLIAFILVAPLLEVDHIDLAQAAPSSESVSKKSNLCIYVKDDNSIWVNQRKVSERELFSALRDAKAKNPSQVPQLFQDKKALFGTYQMVKVTAERAGFERIDLILKNG